MTITKRGTELVEGSTLPGKSRIVGGPLSSGQDTSSTTTGRGAAEMIFFKLHLNSFVFIIIFSYSLSVSCTSSCCHCLFSLSSTHSFIFLNSSSLSCCLLPSHTLAPPPCPHYPPPLRVPLLFPRRELPSLEFRYRNVRFSMLFGCERKRTLIEPMAKSLEILALPSYPSGAAAVFLLLKLNISVRGRRMEELG